MEKIRRISCVGCGEQIRTNDDGLCDDCAYTAAVDASPDAQIIDIDGEVIEEIDATVEVIDALPVKAEDVALEALLPEAHRQAFAVLRTATSMLDVLARENRENVDGLARAEVMIETIRRDLGSVLDDIRRYMTEAAPAYRFEVPGVGVYEKCLTNTRKVWDTDAALRFVRERVAEERILDEETGEIESETEAALRLISEFARLEWRSTPFKNRGTNAAKAGLVETTGGKPTIRRLTEGER